MKILLLTDVPPCKEYTAGIVLHQLCSFLPKESIACFCVKEVPEKISKDLDWIPISYCKRPREKGFRPFPGKTRKFSKMLNDISAFTSAAYTSQFKTKKLVKEIVGFGEQFKPDVVWCTLEGQTMIRLAYPVAKELGVPLLSHVWDHPTWWLREHEQDPLTQRRVLDKFEYTMKNSAMCATASQEMARRYKQDFGTETSALLPSLDSSLAKDPGKEMNNKDRFIISLAGQIYASEEWNALIGALNSVDWKIEGCEVVIRLMGRYIAIPANHKMRIEFYGWQPQQNLIELISNSDISYCPYWFNPAFETEARLSFPAKLTTYLAAGRPVLFHGPEYASPAKFIRNNKAGLCCHSLKKEDILESLRKMVTDKELYSDLSRNGRAAFDKYLTLQSLRSSFAKFLGVDEEFLAGRK